MQDTRLLDFCESDNQRRVVEALIRSDGHRAAAAEALGMSERNVYMALSRIKRRAASQGWAPDSDMVKVAPPGFQVKGVSTLSDVDGQQKAQWVTTTATADRDAHLRESIAEAVEEWRGAGRIGAAPKHTPAELLSVYPMGDPHLGLYTWGEETGEDFDLKIAEANLCESIKRLVACSPKSDTCIILNLGDFFHSDTMDNRTSRSGHALDVDTRWAKVLRAGVRAMMTCIESATKKHQRVIVKNLIGNHDAHTSQMLGLALALFYEGNDRVEVHDDPAKFWFHRFHSVLIGAAHGDTTKPAQLPGIMATDRAQDWGQTKHRYFYTGHIHTQNMAEYPGCIWESFKTLAAKDSWTSSQGYRSGRDSFCIAHHTDHGEVDRLRVDVAML